MLSEKSLKEIARNVAKYPADHMVGYRLMQLLR